MSIRRPLWSPPGPRGSPAVERLFANLTKLTDRVTAQRWEHRALGRLASSAYSDADETDEPDRPDDD